MQATASSWRRTVAADTSSFMLPGSVPFADDADERARVHVGTRRGDRGVDRSPVDGDLRREPRAPRIDFLPLFGCRVSGRIGGLSPAARAVVPLVGRSSARVRAVRGNLCRGGCRRAVGGVGSGLGSSGAASRANPRRRVGAHAVVVGRGAGADRAYAGLRMDDGAHAGPLDSCGLRRSDGRGGCSGGRRGGRHVGRRTPRRSGTRSPSTRDVM